MSDPSDERDPALRASLNSLLTVLIVSSVSTAVVVLFGIAFRS